MRVSDDSEANRAAADALDCLRHCFGMAIGDAGIDDNDAFRRDDKSGVTNAAAVGGRDIRAIADECVNVIGDANRAGWCCVNE